MPQRSFTTGFVLMLPYHSSSHHQPNVPDSQSWREKAPSQDPNCDLVPTQVFLARLQKNALNTSRARALAGFLTLAEADRTQRPLLPSQRSALERIRTLAPELDHCLKTSLLLQSYGAKLSRRQLGLPLSLLRLNTGQIVHMVSGLSLSQRRQIEEATSIALSSFAVPSDKTRVKIQVGEGGQGTVKLGLLEKRTDGKDTFQPLALKKCHCADAAEHELAATTAIKSTYLPLFYGFTRARDTRGQNTYYLAFEYIQGCNGLEAARAFRARPSKEQQYLRIALEYARAIQSIHDNGYFHCDVKLENFLHQQNGRIFINDLGHTHAGTLNSYRGTPGYLPPETDTHYNPAKHDSFSLGVTLLAMVYGGKSRIPNPLTFQGSALWYRASGKFILKQTSDQSTNYQGLRNTKQVPVKTFEDVLIRLLDEEPKERLAIAEAVDHLEKLHLQALHESQQRASAPKLESLSLDSNWPSHHDFHEVIKGLF